MDRVRVLTAALCGLCRRWEAWFMPPRLRVASAAPAERHRARVLLWAVTACPPGAALAWLANRAVGRPPASVELAAELGVLAVLVVLPLLRRGFPVPGLGLLFAGILTAVAFIPVWAYQGRAMPATLLLTTFPAMVMVMVGLRSAIAWCGLVVAGLAAVGVVTELRPDLALSIPAAVQGRWLFAVPCLLTLIQTGLVGLLVTSRNRSVDELQTSRAALAESETRFRAVFEAAPLGIGVFEPDGSVLEVNPRGRWMIGTEPGTPLSLRGLLSRIHPEDEEAATHYLERALSGAEDPPIEFRWLRPNGRAEWVLASVKGVTGSDDAKHFVVGIAEFITERRAAEERIKALAFFDGVTGLANRALFVDRLTRALDLAEKRRHPLAVLFLDLDGFKQVNDRHGHEVGDEVLSYVAERFASSLRLSDQMGRLPDEMDVSRFGGDEFTVLLAEVSGHKGAEVVARRLVAALRRPIEAGGAAIELGVSIGIALYPEDGMTVDALLRNADEAMYRAKRVAGSAYRFHDPRWEITPADLDPADLA